MPFPLVARLRANAEVPMFGALLIHLAVIAAPATVADVTTPNCATVHCSATVGESARNQGTDHSFDNTHDASFDRADYDRSGTGPAH
jgi:hypothetical protein